MQIKIMREYGRFLAKFVIAFLIATICGFVIVHFYIKLAENKGFFVQTYFVDDYSAKEEYNEKSVLFLLNNFQNTTAVYSPLCVENAYIYYALQNNKKLDDVYYVFGNGFQNFELSNLLLDDESIKCFTAGISKSKSSVADINALPNEKLIIDEINAKIQRLQKRMDELGDVNYEHWSKHLNLNLNEKEWILLAFIYNNRIPLSTKKTDMTLILPKLTLESVENPSKYYVKTKLNEDFELDNSLTNVTTVCHLNVHYQVDEQEIETPDNVLDFSKDCIFAIRNKKTKQLVIVGSVL